MSKYENVPAKYDDTIDALINSAVDAAIAELTEKHLVEMAALQEALGKAREQNATADYSLYAEYPDLVELLKKTDLRPGALPSLCALQVYKGLSKASDIAKAIPVTPQLGVDTYKDDGSIDKKAKGGLPSTPKIITSALQKLEKSLLAANTGHAIKVTSIRGKDGDSSVRKFRYVPFVELEEATDDDDGAVEQSDAA